MATLLQDLRYAARMLARSPAFTAVAVVTLALGLGATTAIFSVYDAVLLRPLPYPDADRLAGIRQNVSLLDLTDLAAGAPSIEAAGGIVQQPLDLTGRGEPRRVQAGLVAGSLFELLGARASLGRPLMSNDDRDGGERIAVLSHALWQSEFGADPSVVGRSITLGGTPYAVVGVMEVGFALPEREADLFLPLRAAWPDAGKYRGIHAVRSCWKIRAGAGWSTAQAELDAVARRLERDFPAENKGTRFALSPLLEVMAGSTRRPLSVLLSAVGLLLLVACANLASLLLARSAGRRRELAVRTALGAGRVRLARQLLTESAALALLGGAAGLAVAGWAKDALLSRLPAGLPRVEHVAVNGRVALFALLASLATGLLFGLAPAFAAARRAFAPDLRGGAAAHAAPRGRAALVVAELALALVLLASAGLLIRTLSALNAVDPGFKPGGLVTLPIELPETRYGDVSSQTRVREKLLDSFAAAPFTSAAMVSEVPLTGSWLDHNFLIEGRPPVREGEEPDLISRSVMGPYFATMGIRVTRGRDFRPEDREGATLVGIVNERMVREYFPGEDPIGKRIRWARLEGEPRWIEIVGVAANVTHFGLSAPERPAIYTPYAQALQQWKRWMNVVLKAPAGAAGIADLARRRVWSVDPLLPVPRVRTMDDIVQSSLARQRFESVLVSAFAALALALAAVGVFGVMAGSVRQRTSEIGVRMALGASPSTILSQVVVEGMKLTILGIGLGLAGSLAATRLLSGLLYGVRPQDPATLATVAAILAATSLVACLVPARRATRIHPNEALRTD